MLFYVLYCRQHMEIRALQLLRQGAIMPRRKIDLSTTGEGTILEIKNGKPVEKPALPVVCERIKHYREKMGIEQKALAKMIGIHPNSISNWENGRTRPDLNLLPSICKALDITLYDLFNADDPTIRYTDREQQHIDRYRMLSAGHKFAVDSMIDNLINAENAEKCPDIRVLTYSSKGLAAGIGDPSEIEDRGEPIFLYASPEIDRADYVFSVNGDSMEPDFHSGEMVLVKKLSGNTDVSYGDIGAFIAGNETYIKVYEEDGLHSLNPKYKPMHFSEETVYLIGRVLGVLDPRSIASDADVERYESIHGRLEIKK